MNSGNLIPAYRIKARQKRRLIRTWLAASAGYAMLLMVSYPMARMTWTFDDSLNSQLTSVNQQIQESEQKIKSLSAQLTEAKAKYQATEMVENQSDWSILLAVLAQELGEEIVLKECTIEPDDQNPVAALSRQLAALKQGADGKKTLSTERVEPSRYLVRLRGYGMSQQVVSQFVLRIERSGLFREVTMEETRREGFLQGEAIAFRMACVLGEFGGDLQ